MSRQAWLSFLGLYNWDNTLFDQLVLPEDFTENDKTILINNLLMETAELEVLYTDPDFMKNAIGAWSSKEVITWQRLYNAMLAEYNPIENYNRHETIDTQNRGNTTHSGRDIFEGSVSNTVTNSITSFDNNSFANHDKSVSSGGNTDSTLHGHIITDNTGSLVTNETHGNIGVMSNQDMLQQELDVAPKLNIFDIIIKSFISRFCLLVY